MWSLWIWLVLCAGALAQDDPSQQAFEAFKQGVEASQAERWHEARAYFMQSREAFEKPSTLFNLAVANLELGLAEEALEALDAFDRTASPENHREMILRAHSLRRRAREAMRQRPAPAQPPPGPEPEPEAATAPQPVQATESPVAPVPPAPHRSPLGRALVGGAAVLGAASVGAGVWWFTRHQAVQKCEDRRCGNTATIERERQIMGQVAISLGAAAIAVGVAGAIVLRRTSETAESEPRLSLRCAPTSAALRVRF